MARMNCGHEDNLLNIPGEMARTYKCTVCWKHREWAEAAEGRDETLELRAMPGCWKPDEAAARRKITESRQALLSQIAHSARPRALAIIAAGNEDAAEKWAQTLVLVRAALRRPAQWWHGRAWDKALATVAQESN